ncbi:tail fiber assembly protein [Pseudomonas sp. H1_D05]
MKSFYSQSTGCTYLEGLHTNMPEDAVPIPEQRMLSVIGNPEPGKVRVHDESGLPIMIDPSADLLADIERNWRDREVERILWLRERHRDEQDLSRPMTLTSDQFSELLSYIQTLRDWPAHLDFPNQQARPVAPSWIAGQIQGAGASL